MDRKIKRLIKQLRKQDENQANPIKTIDLCLEVADVLEELLKKMEVEHWTWTDMVIKPN